MFSTGEDEVEDLAKQVGVLRRARGGLSFTATCAVCSIPLDDASQVMCTRCALR
ncbi:hypothetical protein SAMN04487819_1267 [Actinopolyspora alba]|uniref:Uncharacterized protein n=1 Tax=Actinopolyspora alba TaxID=673379 RepID=A0A1I2CLY7_9ACTN|nr:hypothetical protein [Actinopolyspora alba]SFE69155.1 hypothetical protein SAMN04487819_1267 [Actinopolyspora alba]